MHVKAVTNALPWVAILYVIFRLISSFITTRRNAAKARDLGCEEPPVEKNRWPFGIDSVRRALAADRAQQFPADVLQRFQELGTYTYRYNILGSKNFRTADPKNIQAILATQFNDFDLGPTRRGNFLPMLGDGIFTSDGVYWKHSRAIMRPQFTRDQVSDLDLEETHVQNMMRALEPSITADGWIEKVDLLPYFFRLTLDSATQFLFGESVNSQLQSAAKSQGNDKSEESREAKFAQAFDTAQMALATRARFMDQYWLYESWEFRQACSVVHEFVDHFVRLALSKELHTKQQPSPNEPYVFLEALAAETQDPLELRYQLLNLLLAGRDTTASHLGWVFYELSRDPERYKKLREHILADFGPYDAPHEITFARLKDCKYLRYVNDEALRLHPVVPFNARYANKDTPLPCGGGKDGRSPVFVPKGSTCDYGVYVMLRRQDLWGADADAFRPERWEGRKVGWEYLPFNGGPRICIGQQFALTEASYVTVRLLQRFDRVEILDADEVLRHNLTLTNCIANGVKVRMHAA